MGEVEGRCLTGGGRETQDGYGGGGCHEFYLWQDEDGPNGVSVRDRSISGDWGIMDAFEGFALGFLRLRVPDL